MTRFCFSRYAQFLLSAVLLQFALVEWAWSAAGDLDTSFGNEGIVTTTVGPSDDEANSVVYQADGKYVVAGDIYQGSGNYNFGLVRYNEDGSLDSSFDTDGKVVTAIGVNGSSHLRSIALQTDGKILAAGGTGGVDNPGGARFIVVRYSQNGSLDTGFGVAGIVTTDISINGDYANSVVQQFDGKIVAVGAVSLNSSRVVSGVVRYNSNGSLDTTFDGDGIALIEVGSGISEAYSVIQQTDGKLVLAGYCNDGIAVARLNPNGSLDDSFGGSGTVITNFGVDEQASSVIQQLDGKIVVAGQGKPVGVPSQHFSLVRYNLDGSLDAGFDTDGVVYTQIVDGINSVAYSVVQQSDGRLVVGGVNYVGAGSEDIAIARYNTDGSLDTSFSGDGKLTTAIGAGYDYARDVVQQPDGKLIVAGNTNNGSNGDFALLRYESGQPDLDDDAVIDALDPDDDNDGVLDIADAFPLDATESIDNDGDGTGNNADPDDDNDSVADASDAFPLDATESADNDGDGTGNNADALPDNPSETLDTDKDGIGNNTDYDDDNDTLADSWELEHGRDPLVPDYDIAAGGNGGCAITDNGLECWGGNGNGEGSPPVLPNPRDVARGLEHACAVSGNAVVCWGANALNQTAVPVLNHPKLVAAGRNNNCAVDDTGVKCWGDASNGIDAPPVTVKPRNVDVGDDHACAVDASGVKCWGNNSNGETAVPTLQEPTQVSAGKNFSCARDRHGVKCWGDNTHGKRNAPVMPAPKQVDAGEDHACAVAADGVHCWGNNDKGQITVPAGLQNPVVVAAGNKFTCALDEKGIRCWGDGSNGQTTVPSLGVDPDGDGVITSLDAFWLDPAESADNDEDGIGDNGDIDDDNDGVSDALEAAMGTNPKVVNVFNGLAMDSDADGITNNKEAAIGTNPNVADSDSDGITDDLELIQFITNPMSADTDGDSIPDNIDPEPGLEACTLPLNGTYKGSLIGDGVAP